MMKKIMKKLFVLVLAIVATKTVNANTKIPYNTQQLYNEIGLTDVMPYELFEKGVNGYYKIEKQKPIITFIDFSKPSDSERIFIIDIEQKKLLYKTYVSHGRNSGDNYAKYFSNDVGSFKSSLGFYVTNETYYGKNGYSLRLEGLEKGVNDKARERAIVVHGAKYSNPETIPQYKRLGRSLGCPALPTGVSQEIIDTIKGGSVLFIFANDENYLSKSPLLKS